MTDDHEDYPQYGYTQKELRFLYVDCGAKVFWGNDNVGYVIHDNGPVNPLRPDLSGFWLSKLEETKLSKREQFNEYFEEHTGWDPSEYPNKSYVEDLWDFFQQGYDHARRTIE